MNLNRTLFIFSDAHLGEHLKEREQEKTHRLYSFFDHVQDQGGQLIICGDLFDFWFEYRQAIPKRHFHVLHRLTKLRDANIEIHYLAGNHDFWLKGFMEDEIGINVHPNEFITTIGSHKLYVTHGDGLMKSDVGYRFIKKIMRNPVNIFLYRLIHPDFGIPLALWLSHRSRVVAAEKKDYTDADYRDFAEKKINQGFDFVVLGHTHVAALQKMNQGWYVNPGDWMFNFTYAKIENGVPSLLAWNGVKGVAFNSLDRTNTYKLNQHFHEEIDPTNRA